MRFFSTAVLCLTAIGSAWAQPRVTGVVNAANYSTGIAQGSIFVIFGSNLGPATLTSAPGYPLTTSLSGTSIKFTPASGPAFDALVIYTSAGQVAGLLQSQAPTGTYNVTVTYNGQTSATAQATVVARNFGLLSLAASGTGPAVAQIADLNSKVNQFGAPASAGQTIVLYGIGLGPITAPDNNPPGLQDLKDPAAVKVLLGDIEITPIYAGRSPGIAGLDQVNFVIPANAPQGCTVPLRVRVAGANTTSPTSLSIAGAGQSICSSPIYSADTLRKLDAGGSLTVGTFTLTQQSIKVELPVIGVQTIKSESVGGAFATTTLASIGGAESADTLGLSLSVGTCTVYRVQANQSGQVVGGAQARLLDAGAALTLNGPGITNKSVPKATPGVNAYSTTLGDPTGGISIPGLPSIPGQTPSAGISAGTFTLTGPGGSEVGAFTASVRVPTPIVWTNQPTAPIIRSSGLTVTWTGGESTDLVTIFGGSGVRAGGTTQNPIFDTGIFVCTARGDARTFTVPPSILTQIPASSGSVTSGTGVSLLAVQQSTAVESNGRFTAPLTAGGNVDLGIFTYAIGAIATPTYQ